MRRKFTEDKIEQKDSRQKEAHYWNPHFPTITFATIKCLIIFSINNFGESVFLCATGRSVHWLNMYEKLSKSKTSKHFNSVAYFYEVSLRCLHKSKENFMDKLRVVTF